MDKFNLSSEQIEALCKAGGLAPSGRNGQPWQVVVDGNIFYVSVKKSKKEDVVDIDSLGSIFALGCFVENVKVAAEKLNLDCSFQLNSPSKGEGFVAEIQFSKLSSSTKNVDLYEQIGQRATNRQIYFGDAVEQSKIKKLTDIADEFQVKLSCFSSNNKKRLITDTLSKADGLRMANQKLVKQMMEEIRWTESEVRSTKDGLDLQTLGMPPNVIELNKLVRRYPHVTQLVPEEVFAEQTKPLLLGSSHLCCLSIRGPLTYQKVFACGRALEKIWLTATKLNLSIHPWTVLTFFYLRVQFYKDNLFDISEKEYIRLLGKDLMNNFEIKSGYIPILVFRLTKSPPPTKRSLRKDWKSFTKVL